MASRALARLAAGAAVVVAVVGGAASPAWAPKYILGSSAYGECGLPGAPGFMGDFTVQSFHAKGGQVHAVAEVMGSCVDGLDAVATVPGGVYAFPVTLSGECVAESAVVEIRPGAAVVDGAYGGAKATFTLDLSRGTVVDRTWMPGEPRSVRARLCAVDRAAGRQSAAQVARLLNELVLRV